jgi:hypothetical protein
VDGDRAQADGAPAEVMIPKATPVMRRTPRPIAAIESHHDG